MDQPELYVPARAQRVPTRWGLGLARLWFVAGSFVVAYLLWMWLSHLGERVARDYFDAALATGFAWWGVWRVASWIASGFRR
jgi:hypothetical protein